MRVYRGLSNVSAQVDQALIPGAIVEDVGFTSTSLVRFVSEQYVRGDGLLFEIVVKRGTNAVVVGAPEVAEIVFGRGVRLRVLSRKGNRIILEVI